MRYSAESYAQKAEENSLNGAGLVYALLALVLMLNSIDGRLAELVLLAREREGREVNNANQ